MDFTQLSRTRYSCRSYQSRPVDEQLLKTIIDAARVAPSAKNMQPWYFIVITEPSLLSQLWNSYSKEWLKTAPAIIICCGDHSRAWKRAEGKDHTDIDRAIAIDHIMLAATDKGLATCCVCNFDVAQCKSVFNIPHHIEPVALIPVGYPADESDPDRHQQKRKLLDEICGFNNI